MTREMIPYLIIGFFSVFVSSVSQTLLKKADGTTNATHTATTDDAVAAVVLLAIHTL